MTKHDRYFDEEFEATETDLSSLTRTLVLFIGTLVLCIVGAIILF